MIKIKKVLIRQLLLLMVFISSFQSNGHCAPADTALRVPMVFSGVSEEKNRVLDLIVIEKIQDFQRKTPGIKSDTVNRKIKKEFNEATYHLQERVRIGNSNNFYVRSGGKYFKIVDGVVSNVDGSAFWQAKGILVKIIRKAYSGKEVISEVEKVAAKLKKKFKRLPNIREVAEAMPSLQASRNPAALLYKYFQEHSINPYEHGIGKFSGKANLVIRKSPATAGMSFAYAGTRIFLPAQLSGKIEISAAKTPISKETKIDIVDRKNPENRLTVEHIAEQGILRLIYTRPSGEEVTSDITGVNGKTSVTLTLDAVFSDFYDSVFSIPIYHGTERLKAVAAHLKNKSFGAYFKQQERYVNFHGHLYLASFYETHPGRINIYRDRGSWARFIIFEDRANPDNITGYEWRDNRIVPLGETGPLETDSTVVAKGKEMPVYYLSKSGSFRNFDERLDKSVEVKSVMPGDQRQTDISIGTCRFLFRTKTNVSVISFEGKRSKENIAREDRRKYPIRIIRSADKKEIKIGYRDPNVQGEFIVEGLNWENSGPVVFKGPADYSGKRGYFNISTIIEMLRQHLLPGIEASNWLMETFAFSEGASDPNLVNPIRSYKIEKTESGEKFLVEDILVNPKTFLPWHDSETLFGVSKTRTDL